MEAQAGSRAGLASIVVEKSDGRRLAYLSLEYIPPTQAGRRRRYRKALREHVESLGPLTTVSVECPNHPLRRFRERREL